MANWKAIGGAGVGAITLAAGGTLQYDAQTQRIARPATVTTLASGDHTVYAVGDDGSGGRVLVFLRDPSGAQTFHVETGAGTDYQIDTNDGDGGAYPTDQRTMVGAAEGGDADTMYNPRAGVAAEGAVVVFAATHDYDTVGAGSRTLSSSWDLNNRFSVLVKNLGDSTWDIYEDGVNAAAGAMGNVWMAGRPKAYGDVMLIPWAGYWGRDAGNGENRAYLTRLDRSGGSWSHTATVIMKVDSSDPAEQHYHCAEVDWNGTRLRYVLAIGDGSDHNGLYELSRTDLDVAAGASTISGGDFLENPTGWTDEGYIHGGSGATNGWDTRGAQPTFFATINGRCYVGADQDLPGVTSFLISGDAGDPITEMRAEYLPFPVEWDQSRGYDSLVGDVDSATNPTRFAALVLPAVSYTGDQTAAGRIIYGDGTGIACITVRDMDNADGLGVAPDGSVIAGGSSLVEIQPGSWADYRPVLSGPGATNLYAAGHTIGVPVLSRTSVSVVADLEAEGISLPEGCSASATVLKVTSLTAAAFGAAVLDVQETDGNGDREALTGTPAYQVRMWLSSRGSKSAVLTPGVRSSNDGDAAISNNTQIVGGNLWAGGMPIGTTDWIEVQAVGTITAAGAVDPYGFGIRWQIPTAIPALWDGYVIVDRLISGATQRVVHEIDFGETTTDSELEWTIASNPFPLTVYGMTHRNGGAKVDDALTANTLLCQLYADDTNYIDVVRDYTNGRVTVDGVIGGTPLTAASAGAVEWTPALPVTIEFARDGANLLVSAGVGGSPLGSAVTVPGGGSVSGWTLRAYSGVGDYSGQQGALQVGEIEDGLGGDARNPRGGAGVRSVRDVR